MQTYAPVAVPFSAGADTPGVPGRTPTTAHAYVAPATVTAHAGGSAAGLAVTGATAPIAERGQHRALELLEDVFLSIGIVLAAPVVILLLAVPFLVLFRLAAMIAAR